MHQKFCKDRSVVPDRQIERYTDILILITILAHPLRGRRNKNVTVKMNDQFLSNNESSKLVSIHVEWIGELIGFSIRNALLSYATWGHTATTYAVHDYMDIFAATCTTVLLSMTGKSNFF